MQMFAYWKEKLETKIFVRRNLRIGNPIGIHLAIQHRYQYGRYTVEIKFLDLPDDIPGSPGGEPVS